MSRRRELINKLKNVTVEKIRVKMDIMTLDMIISFLFKKSVLRTSKIMHNIKQLMEKLDLSVYNNEDNSEQYLSRIWLIIKILEAMINNGLENEDAVIFYIKEDPDFDDFKEELIKICIKGRRDITHNECKHLIKAIEDRLFFGYIVQYRELYEEILMEIDPDDHRTYKSISEDLEYLCSTILNRIRKTKTSGSVDSFSLDEEVFENMIIDSVNKLKDRNRVFKTGCQLLNSFLSPGFMSKRLYMYLALPGGGKSLMLLKALVDIMKYNHRIETKNPDCTPTILFITMENNIEETIERLYNMTCDNDDIRNYEPKQIIKKLRNKGGFILNDRNNINIEIRYYDNRSINTNDVYSIIEDLEDEGKEVIAFILDYVKRIRATDRGKDEKEELKNITNELKCLANHFDIPVSDIAA